MSSKRKRNPTAERNKGQAWGGAVKVECPHCKRFAGRSHQPICRDNPQRDETKAAAYEKRAKQALETRNRNRTKTDASRTTEAPMTDASPPPEPAAAPEPTPAPESAPAPAPRRVEHGSDFMTRRIAELKGQGSAAPVPPTAIVPGSVSVQSKARYVPMGVFTKMLAGIALIGLTVIGIRMWWRSRRPSTGQSTQARDEAPPRYNGPRAWSPEPTKVSQDVIPYEGGGGFIPSPQTAWAADQQRRLRERMQEGR